MTVYAKIEYNKLITAYNGYNGISGFASDVDVMLANGFTDYTEEEISGYYAGTHQIVDGILTDISETAEYIESRHKQIKNNCCLEYKASLLELKSEDELNLFFEKTGVITSDEYNARLAVITTDIANLQTQYLESEVTE